MHKYETLHAHTKISDGTLGHIELLDLANKKGLGVLAFTDHDTVPDLETLNQLRQKKSETKWIIGIEMTAGLPIMDGVEQKPVSGLHIVGLFVDPHDKALLEHARISVELRTQRMEMIVSNLQNLGFKISANDCLRESGGELVARPHIVRALLKIKENEAVLLSLADQMRIASMNDETVAQQYNFMLEKKGVDGNYYEWPYILFLGKDAFIKGVYVEYMYLPDLDATVKMIRDAGGLSFLAHYHSIARELPLNILEKLFAENRIDGAETVWGLEFHGTHKWNEILSLRQEMDTLITKYSKLSSGGVDLHKPEDLEMLFEHEKYAHQTIGLTSEIISKSNSSNIRSSLYT